MLEKIKKIVRDPKIIIQFFRIKVFNIFQSRKITSKNLKLRNFHKGERCFIIGNGTSISKQNLKLLKNEITFVMNDFYLHQDFKIIHPIYYCLIDEWYFRKENMKALKSIEDVINNLNPIFFLPAFFKNFIEKNKLFEKHKTYYLAFRGPIINTYPKIYLDITRPISGGNFVAFACLFLARYMGFKKIYLVGFDHDWQVINDRNLKYHFYDHFEIPENISREKLYYFKYPQLRKSYIIIKDLFSKDGIEIFNATEGGYLDVFERVKYEDVLKKDS